MNRIALLAAAFGALAACSAAARAPAPSATSEPSLSQSLAPEHHAEVPRETHLAAAAAPASCEVLLTRTANGLRIEALAHARAAFSGEYDLIVTKSGRSGDSDTVQSGPIEAPRGTHIALSSSEISFGRGDRLSARLILRDRDGEVCRDSARL